MTPSTLMGPGWDPRRGTLEDELGTLWAPCGGRSQVSRLRSVLLVTPPASLAAPGDPGERLLLAPVDLPRIRAQAAALRAAYEAEGVRVHVVVPPDDAPPNVIFACDLFWMGPEGAVVARMAARQRAGEERLATVGLAAAGVPIRLTIGGAATFEGADAMWVGRDDVLVGVGRRTSAAAAAQVRAAHPGLRIEEVPVPAEVQHLLGAVNLLDDDLAAVHPAAGAELRDAFTRRGIRLVEVDDDPEREEGRALNFVALGPRAILMPAGCPRTRERYEALGVRCVEVDVGEYLHAAGAMGCATGVIARG